MKTKMKFFIVGYLTFALAFISCSSDGTDSPTEPIAITPKPKPAPIAVDRRETFIFISNGISISGEIFLPSAYDTDKNLPAIYLFDFPETNGVQVATDEFAKVIGGVKGNNALNALVITMDEYKDNVMVLPRDFEEYGDIFKSLTSYVEDHYTTNTLRTFIARGNEANMVLMTLFFEEPETSVFQNFIVTTVLHLGDIQSMLERDDVPIENENKKLYYSGIDETRHSGVINAIMELELAWLEFEIVYYPNLTIENVYHTAFADGINYIFED